VSGILELRSEVVIKLGRLLYFLGFPGSGDWKSD